MVTKFIAKKRLFSLEERLFFAQNKIIMRKIPHKIALIPLTQHTVHFIFSSPDHAKPFQNRLFLLNRASSLKEHKGIRCHLLAQLSK